jgi:hypothetical protein
LGGYCLEKLLFEGKKGTMDDKGQPKIATTTRRFRVLSDPASRAVLLANLFPLAGTLLFGWDPFDVVLLYWMENGVIGLFNVLRMALAQPDPKTFAESMGAGGKALFEIRLKRRRKDVLPREEEPGPAALLVEKCLVIPQFVLHYGGFVGLHLFFLFLIFQVYADVAGDVGPLDRLQSAMSLSMMVALILLIIEHGYRFYKEYWESGEYKRTIPADQMFAPYARIVVMHLAIFCGFFLWLAFSLPQSTAFVLVALKVTLELARLPRSGTAGGLSVSGGTG